MSYVTKEMAQSAILNMQSFHEELKYVFSKYDMDLLENSGRRNCILSQSQEKFLAAEIAKSYSEVISDGRPGQPDIVIGSIEKELECKLTTRNKSGQISFQTDYETLRSKGSLDYIYIIASPDFSEFAVLHFENLTIENFRPPANGSRGRSQMIKSSCMEKCNVLVGSIRDNSEIYLTKLHTDTEDSKKKFNRREVNLENRIASCSVRAKIKKVNLIQMLQREKKKNLKSLTNLQDKINYWQSSPKNYSVILEKFC